MHIPQPKFSQNDKQDIIDALGQLIQQPTATDSPPCPNCQRTDTGDLGCSYSCENAPTALSEEPDKFQIEPSVVPLVFELTTLRLVQTCWSCEGHTSVNGEILKMPQVSFYAEKPVYAQLISQYVNELYIKKKLQYPWEVALSDYRQTLQVIYILKCNTSAINEINLDILQQDLLIMAENLSNEIKNLALKFLMRIDNRTCN